MSQGIFLCLGYLLELVAVSKRKIFLQFDKAVAVGIVGNEFFGGSAGLMQKFPVAENIGNLQVRQAVLIFALIGVPLGLQPTRTPSSMGFALSVVIIFLYYAIMTLANAIARSGAIPPIYAVWIPNIIGLFSGAVLIWRASK